MPRARDVETFSTFDMEASASVGAWRMYMKEVWFRLDVEPLNTDAIEGRLAKRGVGALDASFLSADDQRVVRSRESIASDGDELFCLVFVTRGAFTVRQHGREAFAGPGDAYLLNAQEAYEVDLAGRPEMLCLTMPADLLRARVKHVDGFCACDRVGDRTMSFALRSLVGGVLAEEPIVDPSRLQDLFFNMADMMLSPGGSGRERAFAYSERNAEYVVTKADDVMRARFGDPSLSVAQVASACGVSSRQLQHAFQKAGSSVVAELMKIRLNAAANALRNGARDPVGSWTWRPSAASRARRTSRPATSGSSAILRETRRGGDPRVFVKGMRRTERRISTGLQSWIVGPQNGSCRSFHIAEATCGCVARRRRLPTCRSVCCPRATASVCGRCASTRKLACSPPRREGNRRLYTKKDEIRLQVVRIGVRFGFSLGELKRLIDGHVSRTRSEPETIITLLDREAIEDHIRGLEQRRVELDEAIRELEDVKDGYLTGASGGVIPRAQCPAALA